MKKKYILLSSTITQLVVANIPNMKYDYQFYMDLAANRGVFKPNALVSIYSKNGEEYRFPAPIPDFSSQKLDKFSTAPTRGNSLVNIGRNWVVSSTHVGGYEKLDQTQFNHSSYAYTLVKNGKQEVGIEISFEKGDFALYKTDKFIVDAAPANPFPLPLISEDHSKALPNAEKLQNKERYISFMRAGCGKSYFFNNGDPHNTIISNDCLTPTGGELNFLKANNNMLSFNNQIPFANIPTPGDSGSPVFVYDAQEKIWYFIGSSNRGTASEADRQGTQYTIYNKLATEKKQKEYTVDVSLQDYNNLTQNKIINLAGSERQKDFYFSKGGVVTLETSLYLNAGGLIFDSNYYVVKPSKGERTIKGAGIDIAQNGIVEWYIQGAGTNKANKEQSDFIHKIGKGTLIIKSGDQSLSGIRIGEGTVVIENSNKQQAFGSIALVSGRGTLKITRDFQINSQKLFFGTRGGILDLNGTSVSFHKIYASDNGAKIINSNTTTSTLTLVGDGKQYAYHGNIQGNISLDLSNNPNNHFIFDGNLQVKKLQQQSGALTLQGHPTLHAYTTEENAKLIFNKTGYSVYTTPTKIEQQDWETRLFIFNDFDLKNTSLYVGRNAIVLGNFNFSNSKAYIGGRHDVFADLHDGENVTSANSNILSKNFNFQQKLYSGFNIKDESIMFLGNIQANHSRIELSNTVSNPYILGNFTLHNKILNYSLSLSKQSEFYVKHSLIEEGYQIKMLDSSKLIAQNITFNLNHPFEIKGHLKIDLFPNMEHIITNDRQVILTLNNIGTKKFFTLLGNLELTQKANLVFNLNPSQLFKQNFIYNQYYPIISAHSITDSRIEQTIQITPIKNIEYQTRTTTNSIDLMFKRKKSNGNDYLSYLNNFTQNEEQKKQLFQDSHLIIQKLHTDPQFLNCLVVQSKRTNQINLDLAIDALMKNDSRLLEKMIIDHAKTLELTKLDYSSNIIQTLTNFTNKIKQRILFFPKQSNTSLIDEKNNKDLENQNNLYNNNFWTSIGESYFNLGRSSLMTDLAIGYDNPIINSSHTQLLIGTLLDYTFTTYQPQFFREESHGIFGGLYAFFQKENHQLFSHTNGGLLYSKQTLAHDSDQKFSRNNFVIDFALIYQYDFQITNHHAIRPLLGTGFSTLFFDQNQKLSNHTLFSPHLKAGFEYKFSIPNFSHTFNMSLKHYFNNTKKETFMLSHHEALQVNIGFDSLWFSIGTFGEYSIQDQLSFFYGINAEISHKAHVGISGDFGLSYQF